MDNIDKSFRPTVEWMAKKYDEMNAQLFEGALMECDFEVFTTGKGMEGGTLGWFCIEGRKIMIERRGRRIFQDRGWMERAYVNKENFVSLCRPKIKLNGNYTGTEHAFLATLVHEMCHYYTYRNGYAPVQAHGREFKSIGQIVSSRSNGLFTIQRLASAEQMSEMELSDEMKAKKAKRLANKKATVSAIFDYRSDGEIHLTITSNQGLIQHILSCYNRKGTDKMVLSNDANLIDLLFSKGFRKNMRTWRYWNVENKDWINRVDEFDTEEYINPDYTPKPKEGETVLGVKRQVAQQAPKKPKKIFSIKTSNGVFEYPANPIEELVVALRERFPKMKGDVMMKLMDNPANYRIEENMKNTKKIIESVLREFIDGETGNDSVEITPDMNLGIMSPIEDEI